MKAKDWLVLVEVKIYVVAQHIETMQMRTKVMKVPQFISGT